MANSFITEFGKEQYITYINVDEKHFEVDIQIYRRPMTFWQRVACLFWDASYGQMIDRITLEREDFDIPHRDTKTIPSAQQIVDKAKAHTRTALLWYYDKKIKENRLKNLQKDIDKLLDV